MKTSGSVQSFVDITCIYIYIYSCIGSWQLMTIYLTMFTKTHVSKRETDTAGSRITNAKSIVHFATATRMVFVGLPTRGHREV